MRPRAALACRSLCMVACLVVVAASVAAAATPAANPEVAAFPADMALVDDECHGMEGADVFRDGGRHPACALSALQAHGRRAAARQLSSLAASVPAAVVASRPNVSAPAGGVDAATGPAALGEAEAGSHFRWGVTTQPDRSAASQGHAAAPAASPAAGAAPPRPPPPAMPPDRPAPQEAVQARTPGRPPPGGGSWLEPALALMARSSSVRFFHSGVETGTSSSAQAMILAVFAVAVVLALGAAAGILAALSSSPPEGERPLRTAVRDQQRQERRQRRQQQNCC
uniref:Uncharacterized protein n=1 Tax=Alexandrium monilatum TaxID=311494 RepID=A0A7S4UG37_9DINO